MPAEFQIRAALLSGIPYREGGRSRAGADCVGLVQIGLEECFGVVLPVPAAEAYPTSRRDLATLLAPWADRALDRAGEVAFFRNRKTGRIEHVALHVGEGRLAHAIRPYISRVDRGTRFLARTGLDLVAVVPLEEIGTIAEALQDPALGWASVALFVVGLALSAASTFLVKKPKLGAFRNQSGRYGYDGLITRQSSEVPLPDLLGTVTVPGNAPFTSQIDRSLTVTDETLQRANRVVIFGSGPVQEIDFTGLNVKINGLQLDNAYFHDGTNLTGFRVNPAQTKDEAVTGTIGGDTNVPSVTFYPGDPAADPAVDVRAQYDRNFPLYGFNGCAYAVFRLIDSTKFSSFNVAATILGRLVRTFDANGFVRATETDEVLAAGDGATVRFNLAHADVESVASVTVNGSPYTEISATSQTGSVFHVNRKRGYIEFLAAPASSAVIEVTYTRFVREWSDNVASLIVYLLTENQRGKGVKEGRIDWARAVEARDYFDEEIQVETAEGLQTINRGRANYAIDFKKTLEDHLQAVLDAGYAYLFQSNGRYVIRARKDEEPVYDFTVSTIVQGSFRSGGVERQDRANVVRLVIRTAKTYNAETSVARAHAEDILARQATGAPNQGRVERQMALPAVDSEAQAVLLGDTIRDESVGARWVASWRTKLMGLPLEPGDVVTLTHPSRPSWDEKLFRVEDLGLTEEDSIEVRVSEYTADAYRPSPAPPI